MKSTKKRSNLEISKKLCVNGKGLSLVEVIIAIGIFIIIAPAFITMVIGSYSNLTRSQNRIESVAFAQQGIEATRAMRDYQWSDLPAGTYGLTNSSGYWELSGSQDTSGKYTRSVTISDINPYTKGITSTINWEVMDGVTNSMFLTARLTNWAITSLYSWITTTESDFNGGQINSIAITNNAGGEIELMNIGDWSSASTYQSIDLAGGANVQDIFVDTNMLYVITTQYNSGNEFFAYDISDISSGVITQVGVEELTTTPNSIWVINGYAYIATNDNSSEVMIVRLSDYSLVNSINIPTNTNALGVYAENDILYVVTDWGGGDEFYAYDISDPEGTIGSSELLGSVNLDATINEVRVKDGYAFLATENDAAEMMVIRLSDYTYVNSINLTSDGDGACIEIYSNSAFIGRRYGGGHEFFDIDISNPEGTLSTNGSVNIADDIHDIYVDYPFVYAAVENWSDKEIQVFDLRDYSVKAEIDINAWTAPSSVWFQGGYIYTGTEDNTDTVQVINAGQGGWSEPELKDTYNLGGSGWAAGLYVFVDGDYAYVGTEANWSGSYGEFYVLNISTPTNVTLEGSYNFNADVNSIYVSGDYAYLATTSNTQELLILDISNKANPTLAGSYNSDEAKDGESIYVVGNTAFLGTLNNSGGNDHEFYTLDVSNKSSISKLDSVEISGNVNDIHVSGNYAYLATSQNSRELDIIDISNTGNISRAGSYNRSGTGDCYAVYYDNNYAHLGCNDNGSTEDYLIIDVSTPGTPSRTGGLNLGSVNQEVFVSGDIAYIGGNLWESELMLISIATPSSPSVLASVAISAGWEATYGLWVAGDYMYISNEDTVNEFQVFGPGAVSVAEGYAKWGAFTSDIFDTSSASTTFDNIAWTQAGTGSVKFQIRTANSEANLSAATWVGTDGTNETFYATSGSSITVDTASTGTQWVQFLSILEGDTTSTPIVMDVTIQYSQ
ncbi:beta-propeller domain-containing protein [Patescibacteria group bacterium]|nr:beta-propeller domain-containing protein [Patescibacteria group bacterium]